MNCETVADRMTALASRALPPDEVSACMNHITSCLDCSDALAGAQALAGLRGRNVAGPTAGLFEKTIRTATSADRGQNGLQRFWLGTGFGAAMAASLFAIAVTLGWFGPPSAVESETPQFHIAMNESRRMDIAIETDRALPGAEISIVLAGNVELEGYAGQRELRWAENLDAGVNRLSLPLIATGENGGQLVVRLSHPHSERVYVINLQTDV